MSTQEQTSWTVPSYNGDDGEVTITREAGAVGIRWFTGCAYVNFTEEALDEFLNLLERVRPYPDAWLEVRPTTGPMFYCQAAWGDEFKAGSTPYRDEHKSVPFDPFMKALKAALGKPRWRPKKSPSYQLTLSMPD